MWFFILNNFFVEQERSFPFTSLVRLELYVWLTWFFSVVATADQEGRKEPECPHSNNQDHQIIESVLDPCHFAATPLDISPQNQDGSNYGRESLSKSEDITEEEHDYKGTAPLLIDSDVKPYCHGTLLQLSKYFKYSFWFLALITCGKRITLFVTMFFLHSLLCDQ
jgi:hypothetical protein